MASTTLVITTPVYDTGLIRGANQKNRAIRNLINMLEGIDGGAILNGAVDVHTSATSPVAASATITCVFANTDNDDTVTIGNVTLTGKTSDANETTQFKVETDNATMAESLKVTINANTTLSKYFVATRSSNVVTVTCLQKGSLGNMIGLASSDADGLVVSGANFTSGTGGAENAAVVHK